jgi:hypothetical protein
MRKLNRAAVGILHRKRAFLSPPTQNFCHFSAIYMQRSMLFEKQLHPPLGGISRVAKASAIRKRAVLRPA